MGDGFGKCNFYQEDAHLVVEYLLTAPCEVEIALYTVQGELCPSFQREEMRPGNIMNLSPSILLSLGIIYYVWLSMVKPMVRKFEHELLLEYTIMKNRRNLYKLLALLCPLTWIQLHSLCTERRDAYYHFPTPDCSGFSGVAAVQKYVCYPVNHSTGLADITIPIYTIKVGDMELPITLSYHSAGIKLRQLSGW